MEASEEDRFQIEAKCQWKGRSVAPTFQSGLTD